jgi:hypothetical protein
MLLLVLGVQALQWLQQPAEGGSRIMVPLHAACSVLTSAISQLLGSSMMPFVWRAMVALWRCVLHFAFPSRNTPNGAESHCRRSQNLPAECNTSLH